MAFMDGRIRPIQCPVPGCFRGVRAESNKCSVHQYWQAQVVQKTQKTAQPNQEATEATLGQLRQPGQRTGRRCLVSGCGEKTAARNMCIDHYQQWRYHAMRNGTWVATRRGVSKKLPATKEVPKQVQPAVAHVPSAPPSHGVLMLVRVKGSSACFATSDLEILDVSAPEKGWQQFYWE